MRMMSDVSAIPVPSQPKLLLLLDRIGENLQNPDLLFQHVGNTEPGMFLLILHQAFGHDGFFI